MLLLLLMVVVVEWRVGLRCSVLIGDGCLVFGVVGVHNFDFGHICEECLVEWKISMRSVELSSIVSLNEHGCE